MDLTRVRVDVAAGLTIALCLFVTTKMIVLRRRNLNKKGPIIMLPPVVSVVSLIACLPTLLTKGLSAVIRDLHTRLGTVFTISIFGVKKVTFLVGPEATAHFFQASQAEIRQSDVYKVTVPVVGRGVGLDVDFATRSRQISFCTNAIKPMNLRSHVDAMVQEVEDHFAQWGQNGVVDLKHEIEHLIMVIAYRCLLGKQIRDNMFDRVSTLLNELFDNGFRLDYGILQEMATLQLCIKEALRLHPPGNMLVRHASKGFNVRSREGNIYGIPKGHTLVTCTTVGNSLPYIYKDPELYDPSRFGPGREEDRVVGRFSYTAFGVGRHACIGEDYAYMQIKVIWSHLLRNFDLEMVSPFPEEEWQNFIPGPRGKVMVRYKRRMCRSA